MFISNTVLCFNKEVILISFEVAFEVAQNIWCADALFQIELCTACAAKLLDSLTANAWSKLL